MKKRWIVILTGILIIGLTGCAQKENEDITVVLDWVPNTNHTGLYVAQQMGYFEEEGLNVEIIQPSEGGSADLIAAGQGEFGISYQEQVTYARTAANPLPIKAIAAIIQHNTSGFASPVDRNITTPKNFEGKKYGGWGSPMEVATLKGLMAIDNADFSQVEIVDVGALDFFTAVNGYVDFTWIYYGWDGISAELKDYPINFIRLQDVDPNLDFYTPVIIASEDYLEKNPETARRFLRAVAKGYEYAIANPEEAADMLLADNPEIDRDLAVASQEYLAGEYQGDASQWGVMNQTIWTNYSKWMYDQGLLEKELSVDEAFTNEFLPEQ
ncbi:ABC transporter substrate-binding protein [Acetobacterium bakii]|uniref:ABC transporter substrate-binding protein n=1 Tax=Acetobacterium bakii TaxID=52689 RepID=A0A0L6U6E5_9FIRM|nr:ABC transporter substrate-binding protein [Acetobacterium bakii]KNZ43340.1 ABC transporter substrate-binding protein [Acetobacterium bakii]